MSGRNASENRGADEETPLLHRAPKGSEASRWNQLQKHMNEEISKNWADLILLWCYIITGLLDSSATVIWGSFVSMQTGNTIYLGLGLIAPDEGIRWIKAITSITSFCLGSLFFSRFHQQLTPGKRWVIVASYSLQLLLIVCAALCVSFGEDVDNGLHWQVLIPLAMLAFQSSGQAVTSRVLKYNGLTSVVLTSNYCDLFSDPKILALDNAERNRRVAAPILLLVGAMFGGLWARSDLGLQGALWTAVGLKGVAVVAWLFWKPERDES